MQLTTDHSGTVSFTRMGCSRAVVVQFGVSRQQPELARLLSELLVHQLTQMTAADQWELDDSAPLPSHEQQMG